MDAWIQGLTVSGWVGPVLALLSVGSGLGLVAAALALPRLLAALPADWLTTPEAPPGGSVRVALRGILAAGLLLAGLAMLLLPGQGVLTILAAAIVSPVRGKKRAARWLLSFDVVSRAVNLLRARRGAPPLIDQRTTGTDSGVSARS